MHGFIQRFRNKINGVISGFDRIVFKGCLRPLMFADGVMSFLRSQVANDVNRRFMEQMATLKDDRPIRDILNEVSRPSIQNGRRIRALDIIGKDRELLQALADPLYAVAGVTNKHLRQKLHASPWAKGQTDQQLSARVSRNLRLMRDHGLIRKMPCQRKYLLTAHGQLLTTALNALRSASTQQLINIAA